MTMLLDRIQLMQHSIQLVGDYNDQSLLLKETDSNMNVWKTLLEFTITLT